MVEERGYPSCCGLDLIIWNGKDPLDIQHRIEDSNLDVVVIMHPKDLDLLKKGLAYNSIQTIHKSHDTLIILIEVSYCVDKDDW